jgi:hypothetical protein
MPIADLLVDSMLGNKVISFLDGNAGYNQIFMVKEDVSKTSLSGACWLIRVGHYGFWLE